MPRARVAWVVWGLAVLLPSGTRAQGGDAHSYSRPEEVRVRHLALDLAVDFGSKTLSGSATWTVERAEGVAADRPLILDVRDLTISAVQAGPDAGRLRRVPHLLGDADPILGAPLIVHLPAEARVVQIAYATSPTAGALQWVAPLGTAGKARPFLFSQAQAIHARSFMPCQDTPSVRITYDAALRVPRDLKAVMAAEGPEAVADGGEAGETARYRFRLRQPIPSYLVALAVGDLEFREVGERTGVWAEPSVVEKAAAEFADMEAMLAAAEERFGPYRWGRYDVLVLPPSFPYGGMENPRLTFATPTVLAGDRSQVALIAHEMAHSWSGNLVTNATWRDFWLNEGFTVYLERRIVEAVYGPERAGMEAVLGFGELRRAIAELPEPLQVLHPESAGRDPDDLVNAIAYEKGALFLAALEREVGRERLTAFLRRYFDHFAFRSLTTDDFESYLRQALFDGREPALDLRAWLREPGLPEGAPEPRSERFAAIADLARRWHAEDLAAVELRAGEWSTLEWLQFLRSLPPGLDADRLEQLDAVYHLTDTGNAEIATQWFLLALRAGYRPADPRLEEFLLTVGRRKFLMPLYEELGRTREGRDRARSIFARARAGYHPIAVESVARLLGE